VHIFGKESETGGVISEAAYFAGVCNNSFTSAIATKSVFCIRASLGKAPCHYFKVYEALIELNCILLELRSATSTIASSGAFNHTCLLMWCLEQRWLHSYRTLFIQQCL
jgi:hypothetical protein